MQDIASSVEEYLNDELDEPPFFFLLWKRCQEWDCLPEEGGLLDQDEVIMQQMRAAKIGEKRWQEKEHANLDAERELQEQQAKIAKQVEMETDAHGFDYQEDAGLPSPLAGVSLWRE